MSESTPTVLVLPGYMNSGEGHWQTRWEAQNPSFSRVQMPNWDHPSRDAWCLTLDAAIAAAEAPVLLAAHSLGCLTTAFWASEYASASQLRKVAGALLVALPDSTGPGFPKAATGFAPVPLTRFAFPSIVVASSDDPYCSLSFAQTCANAWGSSWLEAGALGHINAESGLGDWEAGRGWLMSLAGPTRSS